MRGKKVLKEAGVLLIGVIILFTSIAIPIRSTQMNTKAHDTTIWLSSARTNPLENTLVVGKEGTSNLHQNIYNKAGAGILELDKSLFPLITWIHYDSGVNYNGIGLTAGGTFEEAIRLTPNELAPYAGCHLTQVKVYQGNNTIPEPSHSINIKIYDAGTSSAPGALLLIQPCTTVAGSGFQTFVLTTPVQINGNSDMWVSVEWLNTVAGNYPAGVDAGPAVDGKADWYYIGAVWTEVQIYGLDYNNMIWAGIECGSLVCPDLVIHTSSGLIGDNQYDPPTFQTGGWLTRFPGGPLSFLYRFSIEIQNDGSIPMTSTIQATILPGSTGFVLGILKYPGPGGSTVTRILPTAPGSLITIAPLSSQMMTLGIFKFPPNPANIVRVRLDVVTTPAPPKYDSVTVHT